jgi:hypothetical protein
MKTLIQNAVKIKEDGTILKSSYRHDFTNHKTSSGKEYFIDGGTEYIRCSFPENHDEVIDLNLYHEDSIEDKIDKLVIKDKNACFMAKDLSLTRLRYYLNRINSKYVVEILKVIINQKENLNTSTLIPLKGNQVGTGLYLISTTTGELWKSKLIKINKKTCYYDKHKQSYLTTEESEYTFYKL